MAIIIPSKNIFNINYTPLRNNFIDKLEVTINDLKEKVDEDYSVFQNTIQITDDLFDKRVHPNYSYMPSFTHFAYNFNKSNHYTVLAGIEERKYTFTTKIPSQTASYFLNNENVTVTVRKNIKAITHKAAFLLIEMRPLYDIPRFDSELLIAHRGQTEAYTSGYPTSISASYGDGDSNIEVFYTIEEKPNSIVYTLGEKDLNGDYTISVDLYIAAFTVRYGGIIDANTETTFYEYPCELIEYTPQSIDISINGKTFSLEETQENLVISSTSTPKNNFSISSNKLFQSKYKEQITQNFSTILTEYNKGKETLELECSIGEYYDENNNKVISTENGTKMTFQLYDEVIPFIFKSKSQDLPLSTFNNLPKTFVVLGASLYYEGSIKQRLYLQEKGVVQIVNTVNSLNYSFKGDYYICEGAKDSTSSSIQIAPYVTSEFGEFPVVEIGDYAFENNYNIVSVLIPQQINKIGVGAFKGCTSLSQVFYGGGDYEWYYDVQKGEENESLNTAKIYYYSHFYPYEGGIPEYELPPYWHYVNGEVAIWQAPSFGLQYEEVWGENSWRVVGKGTFVGTKLIIPNAYSMSPIKYVANNAFSGENFTEVVIGNSVVEIEGYSFSYTPITKLTLPKSLQYIADGAFMDCPITDIYYKGTQEEWYQIYLGDNESVFSGATIHFNS